MKSYVTYKNGNGKNLAEHVKTALAHFCEIVGGLPLSVVVNPQRKGNAVQVLTALDLARVPVVACAGCLLAEVWLEAPETFDVSVIRGGVL